MPIASSSPPHDPSSPTVRWQASDGLVWSTYDDSDAWVVYNPRSADIQHLTIAARTLWTLVASGPARTMAELADAFARSLDRQADDAFVLATCDALRSMDRAGLIRPVP